MAKVQRHPRLLNNTHPMVYEVNARILIAELSARAGSPVTLATIPDTMIDEWAELGFDAVWLMGLWSTGSIGTDQARSIPALQEEYRRCLPDLTPDDIASSQFAVQAYVVAPALGGNKALRTLRKRLAERGLGLLLDFVCNHTARDHEWVFEHP